MVHQSRRVLWITRKRWPKPPFINTLLPLLLWSLPHEKKLVRQAEESFVVLLLLYEVRDEADGTRNDEKGVEKFRIDEFL